MWRGSKGKNVDNRQEEGPLDDTTSHMPITSSQSRQGESTGVQKEQVPKRTYIVNRVGTAMKSKDTPSDDSSRNVHTLYRSRVSSQGSDRRYGKYYSSCSPNSTDPTSNPKGFCNHRNMVLLVRLVKSMREMDCKPYMGEQGAEIARRWIRKKEKTIIQIKIPEDL